MDNFSHKYYTLKKSTDRDLALFHKGRLQALCEPIVAVMTANGKEYLQYFDLNTNAFSLASNTFDQIKHLYEEIHSDDLHDEIIKYRAILLLETEDEN